MHLQSGACFLPSFQTHCLHTDKAAEERKNAAQPAMFDDSLKCTMCMELCTRPVTVCALTLLWLPKRHQAILQDLTAAMQHAGTVSAQLLPGLLQEVGSARQENVPNLPQLFPSQVCRQPEDQHSSDYSHPYGQARSAGPLQQQGH